ncbi:hypothetical protein CTAYLR_007542 [Chrysophaeum taylorii]|uniref:Fe2OG dioxygenase domain-containing protein n=1 Tax=Chrysophaeum taylorii TaxID=2483200 RepID=A0AAD7XHF6_9STRA|nr:hypothetical protein CTAYLR_007542 [Chrysophaeum taylorii]
MWRCEACTYKNEEASFLACGMCGTERGRPLKLRRLSASPVLVKRDTSTTEMAVQDDEIPAPVKIVRGILPPALADRLLDTLLKDGEWHRGTWSVHGRTHYNSRTTRTFALCSANDAPLEEEEEEDTTRVAAPPEVREATEYVRAYVEANVQRDWRPTFAFGNRYANGNEAVAFHSDFLMALGPRPVIAGLSLGAQRTFRLKKNDHTVTVSLPTPHNSLVVMTHDAQERWQHSIVKCADTSVRPHPRAGLVRFSLTFRMERPEIAEKLSVKCRCDRAATLKCAKDSRMYYLCCNPASNDIRHKPCGFWKKCPWAQQEADRLIALEKMMRPPPSSS